MTRVRAGSVGKLAALGDFVRHNASHPAVEAIDSWFQEGLILATEVLGKGWQEAFDAALPAAYVFQPPGSGRFVAGAWVPSRDAAGRRYPFTVFLSGERSDARVRPSALPAACGGFLEAALRLALELRGSDDPKPLGECVDRLAPEAGGLAQAAAAYESFLRGTTVEGFWESTLGSSEGPARRAVAAGLEAASRSARRGRTVRPGPALQLPLPGAAVAAQALFASVWVDIVLRLRGDGVPPPLLYWIAGPQPTGSLFLFVAGPLPRDFLPLLRPDDAGEHVWDLAADAATSGPAPSSALSALEDLGLTLEAALGRLG